MRAINDVKPKASPVPCTLCPAHTSGIFDMLRVIRPEVSRPASCQGVVANKAWSGREDVFSTRVHHTICI